MLDFTVRQLESDDIQGVVELQQACFPPPFDPELLWKPEHIRHHITLAPEIQFVAEHSGKIVASATSVLISEERWSTHGSFDTMVGGFYLDAHEPDGTTLYGVDISVSPQFRGKGIARALYDARLNYVKSCRLTRFGTACRIPDFATWQSLNIGKSKRDYVNSVLNREISDRTLTPLLKLGLSVVGVTENYMEDEESGHAAAILEWTP